MIYDERIDEFMKDSYDRAYLESTKYVCDCIDRVECSYCSPEEVELNIHQKNLLTYLVDGNIDGASRISTYIESSDVMEVVIALYDLINDEIWDNGNDELKAKFQALVG